MAHTPSLPTGSGTPAVVPTAASTPAGPAAPVATATTTTTSTEISEYNKGTLKGLAILASISLVFAITQMIMYYASHSEKMACMELRKTQPQAECSYSNGESGSGGNTFKPAYVTPPQEVERAPAIPSQVATPYVTDNIPTHRLTRENYKVPDLSSGGITQRRICADGVDINAYPTGDAYYVEGEPIDGGGIIIRNGKCVLLKLKGG